MTLSPHEPRARSPRGPRARWHAAVATLATLVTLFTGAASAPAFAGASPTPSPTPSAPSGDRLSGEVTLTLAPLRSGVVRAGEALTVSVAVENGTDAATPPLPAAVAIGTEPLEDRGALDAWMSGEGGAPGALVAAGAAAAVEPVPSGAQQTVPVTVAAEDPALAGRGPGVYPIVATYPAPDGGTEARSVIVVPDPATTASVAAIVPITAPALSTGLLSADELTELTAPGGALEAQLTGVAGTAAVLAIDPAIPASIRVLGDSAPDSAVDWLERLLSLPNSRFALQFGDADVAVQLRAGLAAPLQPTSLLSYMDPEDFAPAEQATPEPTTAPTPAPSPEATTPVDPAAPVLPEIDELLDIGNAREAMYWPAGPAAGADTVAALAGLGTANASALTLVPSNSTAAGADGTAVPARGDAQGAGVLVYDTRLSRSLQAASLLDDAVLRGAQLATASAELAFAMAEAPGAPLLVSLDRSATRSYVALDTAIAAVLEAPGVTPLSLPGLVAAPSSPVEVVGLGGEDAASETERAAATSALFDDEARLGRFSSILDDPQVLTGPERAELLQLLGVSWLAAPAAWTVAVSDHRAETQETLNAVGMLPPSTTQLISADSALRPWVRNDLPWPVNLELFTSPDDVRLDVQGVTRFTVPADSNARVEIPVQARLGNGDVTVDMQLRSSTFEPIGQSQSVEVVVRAEWESIGLAVLAGLVGVFLLIGVIRTVRRLRRRKRETDDSAADVPEPAGSDT